MSIEEEKDQNSARALYVYIPENLHDYLTQVKVQTGITKSDLINLLLEFSRKYLSTDTIEAIFADFIILGPQGINLPPVLEPIEKEQ